MWRTVLLGHRLTPWCSLLKRWEVVHCIQGLQQQSVGPWSILHRHFYLPSSQCCSLYRFHCLCSNISGSLALVKRFQCSQGTSTEAHSTEKLSSVNQIYQTMEVLPSTETKPLSEDLEEPPPLSPLDEISEDEALQILAEPVLPSASFTLQDYVDHSETLTKLLLLGVDLSKLEQRRNMGSILLRLDFEKDIREKLLFLKDVGLEDSQLGPFLTKNPFILTEDMENLQKRVTYLASIKFSKKAIARIVSGAPYLLNFSVERVDNRLGFFQKELGLSASKVCQMELGFRHNEIQHIVTTIPKILTMNKKKLTGTFDYVHNKMNIPHHIITKFPQVFNGKLLRIKERHMFLMFLGRAQYDPAKPAMSHWTD